MARGEFARQTPSVFGPPTKLSFQLAVALRVAPVEDGASRCTQQRQ